MGYLKPIAWTLLHIQDDNPKAAKPVVSLQRCSQIATASADLVAFVGAFFGVPCLPEVVAKSSISCQSLTNYALLTLSQYCFNYFDLSRL